MGRRPRTVEPELSRVPPAALEVLRRLREAGHEAYLVGGFVRDLLLGRPHKDADVATSATPDQVEAVFSRSHPVGKAFGVVLVIEGGQEVDVVTFRSEGAYEDGRRPTSVEFADLEADASRRDFTINALYYDPVAPEEERVVDPLGVHEDLEARVLRTVGDPDERFREDHLRLLRAVRLAAELDFVLEPATLASVRRNAALVLQVSAERIRNELAHALAHPRRAEAVRLMDATGILAYLLPEVEACKGVRQPETHHPEGDVYVHTLRVLEELPDEAGFPLALAGLLHDVGKPTTRTEEGARVHFHRHEVVGEEMARAIGQRLRLSREERQQVCWLVRHHLVFLQAEQMRRSTLRRYLDHRWFPSLHALHRADAMASGGDLTRWEFVEQARREFAERPARPEPLLSGRDLIALGLEPGPRFGVILREVETAQLEDQISSNEEARELARAIALREGWLED